MDHRFRDVPMAYSEMMHVMRMNGELEDSRNGAVLTLQEPLLLTIINPKMRVLIDPVRNCNPFFHILEFVWMMAGERDVEWVAQFNKKMWEFAEDDGYIHGAYGYRWRRHFLGDQIQAACQLLKDDPTSRRAVIGMWAPENDMYGGKRDLPCNTHIYLRIIDDCLDFTVCNRSNDVIWGMMGANIVHMTFLQELIANELGIPMGEYHVFTNNAHVYLDLPNVEAMLETRDPVYPNMNKQIHVPLLQGGETLRDFGNSCYQFVQGQFMTASIHWLDNVARPAQNLWENREGENTIIDSNWNQACRKWLQRKAQ